MTYTESLKTFSRDELNALFEHPTVMPYPLLSALAEQFCMSFDDADRPMVMGQITPTGFNLVARTINANYEVSLLRTETFPGFDTLGITDTRRRISSLSLLRDAPSAVAIRLIEESKSKPRGDALESFFPSRMRGARAIEDREFIPATRNDLRWSQGDWKGYLEVVTEDSGHEILGFGSRITDLASIEDDGWDEDFVHYFNKLYIPGTTFNL